MNSNHEHRDRMATEKLGCEMRRYLRSRHSGILSTISEKLSGYPFGSVIPFILDHQACPVILVSTLAEHYRNMKMDARTSLVAQDADAKDSQAGSRLTCVADAEPVSPQQLPLTQRRYLRLLPAAAQLLELGDFHFWRLRPKALRFIGGFGRIDWVSLEAYAPPPNELAVCEHDIIEHMNTDHPRNLTAYCTHYLGLTAGEARMVGVDCDGIDLHVGGSLRRIEFESPVHDANEVRTALVAMARTSRGE